MMSTTKEQSGAALAGNHGFSLISNEKLLQLYASMVKCRMIEERVRVLSEWSRFADDGDDTGGREAAAVGVAIDLMPEDTVVFSHRDLVVDFIKGASLESIIRSLAVRTTIPDPVQLSLATSAALANKEKKNGKIAVVFCSDGFGSMDFPHEALTAARYNRLPLLFVLQNTVPPDPENLNAQAVGEEIALMAQACGLPCIAVDGNDVVAVYRVATEAIAHARKGNGPTLIDCQVERSKIHDPILNMETYLERKGLFSEEMKLEAAAAFAKELDAAIKATARVSDC
jgi:TPP-dependent pyruvate/acetoin dehydrogenase alpha subunit